MVYFSCLESLSEDQLNLAIIISQIDCVIVQNIDEVKKIMSIENLYPERTSISLSRNGNMVCYLLNIINWYTAWYTIWLLQQL